MAEIRIKYSDVASSCSNLTSLAEKLEGTITNINNAIAKITDPTWDGSAAQNYVDKLKSISDNIPEAKVQLASSVLFLASCSDGYQSLDAESYKKLVELVGGQSYIDSYNVSKAPDIDLNSRVTDKNKEEDKAPVESQDYVDSGYDGDSGGGGGGGSGDDGSLLGTQGLLGAQLGVTSVVSDGITDIASIKEGEEIEIPDTITQANQSVVGFDTDLKTGEERQYTDEEQKLIELWKSQGSKYTNGIATVLINGELRYLVSVSPKFGNIGDLVDITLKDESTVKAIIFDNKKIDSTKSIYGDVLEDGKTSVVNFEASSEKYKEFGELSKEKWGIEWDPSSPVTKIKNNGSALKQTEGEQQPSPETETPVESPVSPETETPIETPTTNSETPVSSKTEFPASTDESPISESGEETSPSWNEEQVEDNSYLPSFGENDDLPIEYLDENETEY